MSIQTDSRMPDVVIAGAGPTGLLLAGELAAQGVRVVVLECASTPSETPKANGLVGHIVPLLRRRGLLTGTGLRPVSPPRFRFGPLTLRLGHLRNPLHVLPIPQRRLEELLEERARRCGATILRGHEVMAFDQHATQVTVQVRMPASELELRARYLVGCDGAHSVVRKGLGAAFPGVTSGDITRLARVRLPADAVARVGDELGIRGVGRLAPFRSNRTAGGSVTIAPVNALDHTAPPDLYIVSTHEPRGGADPTDALSVEELRASLRRVLGAELPFTDAYAARSTVANSRLVESYRSGRVFLAGDAAHIFSAGGSALNVGLLDAISLGEKLAAVLRGEAPESLLDSYQAERQSAGRRALWQTRVQAALEAGDETGQALRAVFAELLRDKAVSRRLATLIEGGR